MDTGIISTRYAKALYAHAADLKEEDILFEKMKILSESFLTHKSLQKVMEDPTIPKEDKHKLLTTAGGSFVCKSYDNLLHLLVENKRESYARIIALTYQKIHKKQKRIITGTLTTVETPDETTMLKLKTLIVKDDNYQVDFITKTDANIIGGFILDVDSNQLDASIKNQLDKIKRQLTTKSWNIVS